MMHDCLGFQQGNVWHSYTVVLSLISSWSKLTYVQISRLQVHQTIMYPILHCTSFSSLLPMIVSVWSFATVSCWDRFDRVQKADQCLAVVVFDFSDLCMTSWMIHKGTRGVAPKKKLTKEFPEKGWSKSGLSINVVSKVCLCIFTTSWRYINSIIIIITFFMP